MATKKPWGEALVGVDVARDFGKANGGVFCGKVVSFTGGRRPTYLVEYTDGDKEDMDEEQIGYARELHQKNAKKAVDEDDSDSSEEDYSDSTSGSSGEEAPKRTRKKKDGTGKANKDKGTKAAQSPSAVSKPAWKDVCAGGSARKFKPVIDRKKYEDEKTRPKFHLPCKETRDISPGTFGRLFFTDKVLEDIAKHSEAYRLRHGVRLFALPLPRLCPLPQFPPIIASPPPPPRSQRGTKIKGSPSPPGISACSSLPRCTWGSFDCRVSNLIGATTKPCPPTFSTTTCHTFDTHCCGGAST